MFHSELNDNEKLVIGEVMSKFEPIRSLDLARLSVDNRIAGQWYLELSYHRPTNHVNDKAYDADILAYDADGNPLGLALFYNDDTPLSKIQVFRYDGCGEIVVSEGTVKIF